jgi:hypothetical protein
LLDKTTSRLHGIENEKVEPGPSFLAAHRRRRFLMKPRSRKVALIVHISFSVGWLGAVLPYLALSIVGLTSHDSRTVSGAYLAMKLVGGP